MKDCFAILTEMNLTVPNEIADFIEALPASLAAHKKLAENAVTRLFLDSAEQTADGQVYLSTGDIPAMWLRDSSFQIRPLLRFTRDPKVYEFCAAVIARQAFYVAIDPYANAFNSKPDGNCWHKDFPDQSPWVFERKWEIDSLASFLDVSAGLAQVSGRTDHLDAAWHRAAGIAVATFETEQKHDPTSYRLLRKNAPDHDHLSHDGYGAPFANTGMIWSAFRPSDDACELAFNIPQNAYAVAALRAIHKNLEPEVASIASKVASKIEAGIREFGIRDGAYLYEVDGLGNSVFMDDANFPSLLSLPYLGFCNSSDTEYQATRARVLSSDNPWYFVGTLVSHIGSPHTGPGRVWPLAMAMEILTSAEPRLDLLAALAATASPNGALHESIATSDFSDITREWFSWAEMTLFDALCYTAERI